MRSGTGVKGGAGCGDGGRESPRTRSLALGNLEKKWRKLVIAFCNRQQWD